MMKNILFLTLCLLSTLYLNAQLMPFEQKGKWGYKDKNGNIVIKAVLDAKFDDIQDFGWIINQENKSKVDIYRVALNKKYGFITKNGKQLISLSYTFVGRFYDKFIVSKDDKNWGVVDRNEKTIIPFKYKWHFPNQFISDSGYEPLRLNSTGKWSICDSLGNILMDFKYDYVGFFRGDIAPVELNKKYGFINKKGEIIVPPKYDNTVQLEIEYMGPIPVNKGAVWKEVKENDYSYTIREGGKWGFINQEGKEITAIQYDEVDFYFKNGTTKVKLKNKWGIIDESGKILLECKYDEISDLKGGGYTVSNNTDTAKYVKYRIIKNDNKLGLLNAELDLITDCLYDEVEAQYGMHGGIFKTKLNDKFGYLNLETKLKVAPQYEELDHFHYNSDKSGFIAKVKKNGKYGFIDISGKEIIPIIYEEAYSFWGEKQTTVTLDGRRFKINEKGNEIKN